MYNACMNDTTTPIKRDLSCRLFDAIDTLDLVESLRFDNNNETKKAELVALYVKTIELVLELGWLEHTNDWDHYVCITFVDDTDDFHSSPGTADYTIEGDTLVLEGYPEEDDDFEPIHHPYAVACDPDDSHFTRWCFPISNIATITPHYAA